MFPVGVSEFPLIPLTRAQRLILYRAELFNPMLTTRYVQCGIHRLYSLLYPEILILTKNPLTNYGILRRFSPFSPYFGALHEAV